VATFVGRSWFEPAPDEPLPISPVAIVPSAASDAAARELDAREPSDNARAERSGALPAAPLDAGAVDASIAGTTRRLPADAAPRRDRAVVVPLDARAEPAAEVVVAAAVDAAPVDPVHAHVPPLDAALASGFIQVTNRVWCEIWIDGVDRGRTRNVPLEVTPGPHV